MNEPVPLKAANLEDPNQVPVTFINEVSGSGFLNGVINLTLSTYNFTPGNDAVQVDAIVTSRLRMDLWCAQQLHKQIGDILEAQTKGPAQPAAKAQQTH